MVSLSSENKMLVPYASYNIVKQELSSQEMKENWKLKWRLNMWKVLGVKRY